MTPLSPQKFFDTTNSPHRDLFANNQQIWEIIPLISSYIKKYIESVPQGKRIQGTIHPQAIIEGDLIISKNATIGPGAYIVGPTIIEPNAMVSHAAYIRGNVIVGSGSIVGHATEVKNSILMHRVWASHFAYIGDSIIGNHTELGAGVKLANFRLDEQTIKIKYQEQNIETGLQKLGSVVGDKTSIGCNSVLNPGTLLEKNCLVYPLTSVSGHHPKQSIIHR